MIGGSQGSPAGHGRVDPRSRDPRTLSAASPVGLEPVGLDGECPEVAAATGKKEEGARRAPS